MRADCSGKRHKGTAHDRISAHCRCRKSDLPAAEPGLTRARALEAMAIAGQAHVRSGTHTGRARRKHRAGQHARIVTRALRCRRLGWLRRHGPLATAADTALCPTARRAAIGRLLAAATRPRGCRRSRCARRARGHGAHQPHGQDQPYLQSSPQPAEHASCPGKKMPTGERGSPPRSIVRRSRASSSLRYALSHGRAGGGDAATMSAG
jgi:hypothetical protein